MNKEPRTERLTIRFSPKEKALIIRAGLKKKLGLSDYIRNIILESVK